VSSNDEIVYKVTGILEPVSGPVDSAIYASYRAVWRAHGSHDEHGAHKAEQVEHHQGHEHHKDRDGHEDHEGHVGHEEHGGDSHKGCPNYEKHHGKEIDEELVEQKEEKHKKHEHHEAHEEHHTGHDGEHAFEKLMLSSNRITAVLVRTKNPVFTGQLEREWSLHPGTQAVDTGRTIKKVVGYLNKAENIVGIFTALTLGIVIVMILVTIVMSLNERKKELALMRSLGIGRFTISTIIMFESFILTLGGMALGLIPGHLLLWWSEVWINDTLGISVEPFTITMMEINGVFITFAAGQLMAAAAMILTYRMNIVEEIARD